jgi:hypothetical protein
LVLETHAPAALQVGPDWVLPEQVAFPQTVPTGFCVGAGQVAEDPEQTAALAQLVAARHCVPVL